MEIHILNRRLALVGAAALVLAGCTRSTGAAPAALTENDFASDSTVSLEPRQIGVTFMETVDAEPSGMADTRIPGLDIIPFEVTEEAPYEYTLDPRGALSHAVIATGDAEAVLLVLTPASPTGSVVLKPGWYALLLVSGNTTSENHGDDSRTIFLQPNGQAGSGAPSLSRSSASIGVTPVKRLLSINSCAGCDLTGAKLQGANLNGAELDRAVLTDADLSSARLRRASLRDARLNGAILTGADLSGATWTDGTICGEGSIGKCLTSPTTGFVSLVVSPAVADLKAGGSPLLLTLRGTTSDGATTDVAALATWTTSAPGQVDVTGGSASAPVAAGIGTVATLTATHEGRSASTTLTVVRAPAIGVALANDPLAVEQWYLLNTGQKAYADVGGKAGEDMKLARAHRLGLTGKGVKVAIVDDGLEIKHEDLADNVVTGSWNFADSTNNPSPTVAGDNHGTAVAGITGMVYGNGKGGMGVAPGVSLNGYNLISDPYSPSTADFVRSLGGASDAAKGPKSDDVWIFNMSYGAAKLAPVLLDPVLEAQYVDGTSRLREKRGVLYVKSAGNEFESFKGADCAAAKALGVSCGNANQDGDNTVPYFLVVGALDASGKRASYSTAGSALWMSAPGGESGNNASFSGSGLAAREYQPAMITTDRMTCTVGYARSGLEPPDSSFNGGSSPNQACNYTNTFNGTSSAAPSATGAIALLLEARPALTWREVKHVLAKSARKVDASVAAVTATLAVGSHVAEQAWVTNAAGYPFHNWYGFGAVDVDAAVETARTFVAGSLGTFANTGWVASAGSLDLSIPDNSATGASSTLSVTNVMVVEAVQIHVDITHPMPGDLGIELTSPSATKSILLNIRNGFGTATDLVFVLESNAFYGEAAKGSWTVKIVDGRAGNSGTLNGWKIRIFGH